MRVIGITGHPSSGKDTVADVLVSHGWGKLSTGDHLRAVARKASEPDDRASVQAYAAGKRAIHGNWWPCQELSELEQDTAVVGFRNECEIAFFRGKFGKDFLLWAVHGPSVQLLYERARLRNGPSDQVSLGEFLRLTQAERATTSGAHDVDRIIALADMHIKNNSTLESLAEQVGHFLEYALKYRF